MRILHYALGFPPYRSGGLTKYCIDLMLSQKKAGHEIEMMWPGRIKYFGHFVRLKRSLKSVKSGDKTIKIVSIELVNPLPVPLDEGIADTGSFMDKCPNPQVYKEFLKENSFDAIHIHTLMGLHKEFLEVAKELGVRIVFTSHDYFGICPKVTLFRNGRVCDGDCSKCTQCNEEALSLRKIQILQSGLYRALKDRLLVKKLRQRHRTAFFSENEICEEEHMPESVNQSDISDLSDVNETKEGIKEETENKKKSADRYEELRKYYIEMLSMVDIIHFNSSVTESVYRKFIPEDIEGKVVNITHENIQDHRKMKKFIGKLKITYLAAAKPFKGFNILTEALDEIFLKNKNFQLNVYSNAVCVKPYMSMKEKFEYHELESIFDNTDILIAPSIWYETFGFTVLEALSYGVPVIVSENVGAKDLLESEKYGMIISPDKDAIKEVIEKILDNRDILERYNRAIVEEMDLERVLKSDKIIEKMYL